MPPLATTTPQKRAGWKLAAIVVGTAVIAGSVSAAALLAIDRPHRWGVGAWISDFAKSPGMAGLFALVAAAIAFWGIQRQVTQSRRTLDHQQDVEQDRAWWTRFEWAAERAVPASKADERLPWAAVVSTFEALASSARDDVQRRAVGAIMEVAADVASPETHDQSESATAAPTSDRVLSALRAYVNTTADTPAQSAAVTARLYEAEVLQALQRVFREAATSPGTDLADAVIDTNGQRILVEIKAYTATPGPNSTARLVDRIRDHMRGLGSTAALVIAPLPVRLPPGATDGKIVAVRWVNADDDAELARTVRDLTI